MKKFLVLMLLVSLLTASVISTAAATAWGTSIMYVKTENGRPVVVRSAPYKGDNIIGSVAYGDSVLVDWSYAGNDGWFKVVWGSRGDGYIMARFLVDYYPGKAPTTSNAAEVKTEKQKLDSELKSEKDVADEKEAKDEKDAKKVKEEGGAADE